VGNGHLAATRPPLERPACLRLSHVDFSYGPLQVLFDVSLHVAAGEVLALLGTNGAGKSTVLRLVSGLAGPTRGEIEHLGVDITALSPAARVRRGLVQMPGGHAVFPDLTVDENLRVAGITLRRDRALLATRTEEVLELFPSLRARARQRAGLLSGGEQQMLGLAKCLLLAPRLLCVDELSMGLAPAVVEELLGVVAALRARGTTMVIVEQSVNLALAMADRAVFMEKGHVRFEGPAAELAERDDIVRAVFFGGPR
jgi:ABC-type branched-subunit amino acid transport system ATPase component